MPQPLFVVQFLLAALAVWRVTHLLAFEDGPGDLIVKLRALLGDSFAGKLMDCFLCLSLWIAAPAALLVTRAAMEWLLVWLALSGAACLLERTGPQTADAQPHTTHSDLEQSAMPQSDLTQSQRAQPTLRPIASEQNQPSLMQQFLEGENRHVLWPEAIRNAEHHLSPGEFEDNAAAEPEPRRKTAPDRLYRA
jgi:hypothetical protein